MSQNDVTFKASGVTVRAVVEGLIRKVTTFHPRKKRVHREMLKTWSRVIKKNGEYYIIKLFSRLGIDEDLLSFCFKIVMNGKVVFP